GVEIGAQVEWIREEVGVAREMNPRDWQPVKPGEKRGVGRNRQPRLREGNLEDDEEGDEKEDCEPQGRDTRYEPTSCISLGALHGLARQNDRARGIPGQAHHRVLEVAMRGKARAVG